MYQIDPTKHHYVTLCYDKTVEMKYLFIVETL